MASRNSPRVCPVERAGHLENPLRRLVQNPRKLLAPHVAAGMTALDVGCGPGFFSLELARLVGPGGRVIAADLQEGMLRKLESKVRGTELGERILLHKCETDRLRLPERIDFALAFYMAHELPDQAAFFREIAEALQPDGRVLLVEPPFHVSRKAFAATLALARDAGLELAARPRMLLSKAALLRKA